MNQIIVCAAIKHRHSGIIVCGVRHFDSIMRSILETLRLGYSGWEQGFVDQKGKFLTREEAWTIADNALQLRRPTCHETDYNSHRKLIMNDNGILFSENLY